MRDIGMKRASLVSLLRQEAERCQRGQLRDHQEGRSGRQCIRATCEQMAAGADAALRVRSARRTGGDER